MSVENQTKTPEIKEIERLIIERAIKEVMNNPEKYWESLLERVAALKTIGIRDIYSGNLDEIIGQGWDVDDLEIADIENDYYGISINVRAPNGIKATVSACTKSPTEMNKEEYIKFRELSSSLISKVKIALLEKEKKELEERIRDLKKEIEELRLEKRKVEEYCKEKRKEYDITYEDARNMLEFINEKGLLDEYIDWLNMKDKEELKSKLLSYYGIIEDDDC